MSGMTMTVVLSGDDPAPAGRMTGTRQDIPIVHLDEDGLSSVMMTSHNDPAKVLRQWAANLMDLADQVDANPRPKVAP